MPRRIGWPEFKVADLSSVTFGLFGSDIDEFKQGNHGEISTKSAIHSE
jgi:hypothetical protein